MYQFFLGLFLIISIILVILIMLQQNQGNSIGGAFDNRSLGDMLNVRTFNSSVTRCIVILAILFFLCSLILGNMNSKNNQIQTQHINQENVSKKES